MTFQFTSFSDFLVMSGHGIYVWSCYGITVLALVLLVIHPYIKRQQLRTRIVRRERLEQPTNPLP